MDKTIIHHPFGIISEWFIPLYGDLGDGYYCLNHISFNVDEFP